MKVLNQAFGKNWAAYHGDSCEVIKAFPDNSIHFHIFSPPFSSLYTYNNSERDMGNSSDSGEFFEHFKFLTGELYRTLVPGRLMAVHCMNLPTSIQRHGVIGMEDFRGDLVRHFKNHGFIFHSEICIWKNPVTAMQRTKAIGLLHKQVEKDSALSRQGIPDYVIVFRKPGKNPEPIEGRFIDYYGEGKIPSIDERGRSIDIWQRYASPVWMDIDQSDTLNNKKYRDRGCLGLSESRDEEDKRHICPLQLDVIRRCLQLWTNPGDIVYSPFGGIGSEGFAAVEMGRKAILSELKGSYFKVLTKNMKVVANDEVEQLSLLDSLYSRELQTA